MFILKKGHQPGVYVPLRALFLVCKAVLRYCAHLKAVTRNPEICRCRQVCGCHKPNVKKA